MPTRAVEEFAMRMNKASHRAARQSLDGHIRFLAHDGRTYQVVSLHDLPQCRALRIEAAYSAGRMVRPR
ncbi:hypothetical protein WM08_14985 [Burkholderia ubonensis]|nr:hypothetical protein WJ94_15890 [Burkholderia ubonensis]KVQ87319.1 hypothetical protein WK09_19980 [Burkholderia ubonensis]KVV12376.1 hypothetical protein WK77_06065 [Burkholderia ubonensis]KWB89905.1 hypothetical protein WL43_07345 [Burkholderia ubonensis]KWI90161.1 hypothetical protein WM08_14985 [Burkholderia ubonensis]